jgi:hypothetical protein
MSKCALVLKFAFVLCSKGATGLIGKPGDPGKPGFVGKPVSLPFNVINLFARSICRGEI